MSNKLTDKQEVFCQEYIIDLNATQSAIRAGYSAKTANRIASQLLSKLDIQEKIAELKLSRSERTAVTSDWVLISARRVFERCMQDEPVLDRDGNPVMCTTENGELAAAYEFNASGANKALELCGKHVSVKAWDKEENKDNNDKVININFVKATKPNEH